MADSVVGLLLDEAREVLDAAGAPMTVVEVSASGSDPGGRWRVIRVRVKGEGLELTVARQRELAEAAEPGG